MEDKINEILELHRIKKFEINERLNEFKSVLDKDEGRIFEELIFCICTPQSKATTCWNVIQSLKKNNLLLNGTKNQIRPFLNSIRFGDTKIDYIILAQKLFTNGGKIIIKNDIEKMKNNPLILREWLIKNVKGFGMKESSHFIRNIGLSDNKLAILDVHILKNLKELGIIKEVPKSLTKKIYLEIENKMKKFADHVGISLDKLDLLFWSKETGMVFK